MKHPIFGKFVTFDLTFQEFFAPRMNKTINFKIWNVFDQLNILNFEICTIREFKEDMIKEKISGSLGFLLGLSNLGIEINPGISGL